jgi:hypothetical protein
MVDMPDEEKSEGEDLLSEAKEAFEKASTHESENRATALEDIKFARLGEQWPANIKEQREQEHRPCLTINKMPSFIRQVVNDARQNKPSIKVHAADNGADPRTAEVINGLIRNIEYTSNADVAYDTAIEASVAGGFGYWRVTADYAYEDAFELDLKIERISNQFSVYGDPNSTCADSSDWDTAFIVDRISKDEFNLRYGKKTNVSGEKVTVDWSSEAWSDSSEWLNEDGVLIAEWWRRTEVEEEVVKLSNGHVYKATDLDTNPELQAAIASGAIQETARRTITRKKVTQTFMSGADILETNEWQGCYIPIIPVYGDEIVVQGKRYFRSLIHNAKDAQRMFNYWRTSSTELVALAPKTPWIGRKGTFDSDASNWATANSKSHAYLEFDGEMPQRQPLDSGVAAGSMQEAMNSSDDMKSVMGIYDASLGARSNETSGKAIMARQREGDVATFHFIDNLARAIRHTGRILIDLIPKVYSAERMIRVIGEDGSQKNVQLNPSQGVPVQSQPKQIGPNDPEPNKKEMDENGVPTLEIHNLTLGKYDLTVTTGPSFTTQRQEAAEQMMQLLQSFPQAAPVIGDLLAKSLDWPGADEIAERLEKLNPTNQPQIPPELQQQIEEGKQRLGQLEQENQKLAADADKSQQKLMQDHQFKMAQLQQDFEFKKAQLDQEKRLKMMADDGVEEVGPDGESVIKTRADVQNESIMQGLTMIAQLVSNSAQQNNDKLDAVAQLIAAPTVLERDAQGRPFAARKVMQ